MSDVIEQFRQDFFPNSERHTVTFDILTEDWQVLESLFAENELSAEDGLRFTLAAGRAYLEAATRLAVLQHPEADLAREITRLQHERMQVESRYAVMKYRAYSFMQAAQLMEMKLNACRAELEGLRTRNQQLRQQLDQD